ncbi:uncharacterized protein LTHEOB_11963 [Lasiodiplodia theobromae]|uniref:uncharacterized protein n=1 Tax=Lasiodiplodia theobromae TaxID=45133 RepID=UPI0015C384D7|nr:uncharacterized protein LTHEOB_11963 [Lasiodiplodia theobromae]KAF4536831.1 hypothetical protein LTHEOB_11963 [Lasiodiplodia theobromae]
MTAHGDPTVGHLVEQLAIGFDALSSEYRILHDRHRELENKLVWAKQQYLDLLKRFTPDIALQDHKVFVQSLEEVERHGEGGPLDWLDALAQSNDGDRRTGAYIIRQAERARDQLKYYRPLQSPLKEAEGVKIWNGRTGDRASDRISKLESLRQAASAAGLERDFTTPGTPGKLGCPFGASSMRGRSTSGRGSLGTPSRSQSRILPHAMRSKRSSFNDPIRADICAIEPPQSPDPSVSGSAQAVCPIRFMDDHSPEEIAKYFENHKHELPRSHEVCIKRFQSNAESIRQLDAKYGNLVNMIQGLGEKHQPMLKESPTDEDAVVETESGGRVADWAKAVSTSAQAGGEASPDPEQPLPEEEEERQPHFDRPLKDIRVGESPSRPWGITVPAAYNKPPSIATDGVATASPVQDSPPAPPVPPVAENRKPGKCPFDHTKLRGGPPVAPKVEGKPDPEPEQKTLRPDAPTIQPPQDETIPGPNIIKPGQSSSHSPQMVFTGPVFIGYSMEQALALLQQTNMVGKAG